MQIPFACMRDCDWIILGLEQIQCELPKQGDIASPYTATHPAVVLHEHESRIDPYAT